MNPKPLLYGLFTFVLLTLSVVCLFRSNRTVEAAEEHAVIVKLKLASGPMGNKDERARINELEDRLSDSAKRSSARELDGEEYGGGLCTIYMYGPDAERLFSAVKPALDAFHAPPGSYVIKRYGKPGSKQDRIALVSH
jgi:hypothetical protein